MFFGAVCGGMALKEGAPSVVLVLVAGFVGTGGGAIILILDICGTTDGAEE